MQKVILVLLRGLIWDQSKQLKIASFFFELVQQSMGKTFAKFKKIQMKIKCIKEK